MKRGRRTPAWSYCYVTLLLGLAVLACNDDPEFMEPGGGDFVQFVQPEDGATLAADEFLRRGVALVLNFFPAEGRFGFGALQSFKVDGDGVLDRVVRVCEPNLCGSGPPPERVSLTFAPDDADPGGHEVEVVYLDSRGTVHRIRWSFMIGG